MYVYDMMSSLASFILYAMICLLCSIDSLTRTNLLHTMNCTVINFFLRRSCCRKGTDRRCRG